MGDRPEEQAERGRVQAEHLQGTRRASVRSYAGQRDRLSRDRAVSREADQGRAQRQAHQQHPRGAVEGLNYAEQAKVIASAPSVGMLKVERPEIVAWSLEEYATLLTAAKALDPMWYAACCLAGEAGLRVGEIRALDWTRDVDLVAGTI